MKNAYLSAFISLLSLLVLVNGQDPVVRTKYGDVEGTFDGNSRGGNRFYQFKGIQYAVVEERFKASVEPVPWNGIKPAKEFGRACNEISIHGDENCLFLNVWTPSLPDNGALLPVVVYIHGGSFQGGSGNNYGPNYLMDSGLGVVYLTINYRLGLLGFLSTEDEVSPGNYGLKDQVMALKWIQQNIAAFGGDPAKVTIMGQSAGGASVTYHLISPMSQGLFRYAMPQSGTFLDPWAHTIRPLRYARKMATHLNCSDTSTSTAIVNCLKDIPATIIGNRQLSFNVTMKFFEDPIAAYGPTIEPIIGDGSNNFLTESPYDILVSGNFSKVPILTGVVKEEGIYLWAAYLLHNQNARSIEHRARIQANFTGEAPSAFYFDEKLPPGRLADAAERLEQFYFNGSFSLENNLTFPQLSHLYSDRMFVSSSIRFMNLYSKHAPTYPYLYTFNKYVGIEFGWEELHTNYSLDATHAAELDMLVSPLFNRVRNFTDHDELSEKVVKLWTSFIQEGVPSATYGSALDFPPINASEGLQKFYRIDTDTELIDNIFAERVAFWDSLELADNDFRNCYC